MDLCLHSSYCNRKEVIDTCLVMGAKQNTSNFAKLIATVLMLCKLFDGLCTSVSI